MPWGIRIKGELHKFPDQSTVIIGRGEECDLKLQSRTIELKHAVLEYNPARGTHSLRDLGSVNGTYLNEVRLGKNDQPSISVRDILKIGRDIGVLRIEELPSYREMSIYHHTAASHDQPIIHPQSPSISSQQPQQTASSAYSPQLMTQPLNSSHTPLGGVPLQYFAVPQMHPSPQHSVVQSHGHPQPNISYMPMTYYIPVTAATGVGSPESVASLPTAHLLPPQAQSVAMTTNPNFPMQQQNISYHPSSLHSQTFQKNQPPSSSNLGDSRLFYPAAHPPNPHPPNPHPPHWNAEGDMHDMSSIGELTQALLNLESDNESLVNPVPSAKSSKMPNFDSDVSSNFTSVSKQAEVNARVKKNGSLKRQDGRGVVDISKSPTLSRNSSLYGKPDWWGDKDGGNQESRSRSSSSTSDDILEQKKTTKLEKKLSKKKRGGTTLVGGDDGGVEVTRTEATENSEGDKSPTVDQLQVEDIEGNEHNGGHSSALDKPQQQGLPHKAIANSTITLTGSEQGPSEGSVAPDSLPSDGVPTPSPDPSSEVVGLDDSLGFGTTWTISFDDDNKPKSRKSLPSLSSLAKRLSPKKSDKQRKSVTPSSASSLKAKGKKTTPLPRNQYTPPVGKKATKTTLGKQPRSKSSGAVQSKVKGDARSSSPFARNTTERRTYTKKDSSSAAPSDLPQIANQTVVKKEKSKKVATSKETGKPPKDHQTVEQDVKGPHLQQYDTSGMEGLEGRKVEGEEGGREMSQLVAPGQEEMVVVGEESIVAANFGVQKDDPMEKALHAISDGVGGAGEVPVEDEGGPNTGNDDTSDPEQTPNRVPRTPTIGLATSSPKDSPSDVLHLAAEGTTPHVPKEPNDAKNSVGSARRQWSVSQSHSLDGLMLSNLEQLSIHLNILAVSTKDKLNALSSSLKLGDRNVPISNGATTSISIPTIHKEPSSIFQNLKETEERLLEINDIISLLINNSSMQ